MRINILSSGRKVKVAAITSVSVGIAVLLVSGPLQTNLAAMQAQDGLYIPETHHFFSLQDAKSRSKTLTCAFTIYNGRFQSLHLEAKPDCGCTSLSWHSTTIPPFGRKELEVIMPNNPNTSINILLTGHRIKPFFLTCSE